MSGSSTRIPAPFFHDPARSALYDVGLSDRAFRLYSALESLLMQDRDTWPIQSRVALMLGVSLRTVSRAMRELRERGYVAVVGKFDHNGNIYRLLG